MIKTDNVKFEITSGRIVITDPCYDISDPFHWKPKAKNGIWVSDMQDDFMIDLNDNETDEIGNISGFKVCHESYDGKYDRSMWQEVSVDSGCIGVFDLSKYPKKPTTKAFKEFYQNVLNVTSFVDNSIKFGSVGSFGFAAKTTLGDGSYRAVLFFNEQYELVCIECCFV